MWKIPLFLALFTFSLFGANNVLTQEETVLINKGILESAIPNKDYATINTMAFSFYSTSISGKFKGDSKALFKRSLELYELSHNGGYILSSLFLVRAFLKDNPKYSRKIAREAILAREGNKASRRDQSYINLVMLYVSSVLDYKQAEKQEVNFALEAIQGLPKENTQTKFYSAFLLNSLGMEEIANTYLNDACQTSKKGGAIYNYCTSGELIEMEDMIEKKVANPDCKKDLGQRCK